MELKRLIMMYDKNDLNIYSYKEEHFNKIINKQDKFLNKVIDCNIETKIINTDQDYSKIAKIAEKQGLFNKVVDGSGITKHIPQGVIVGPCEKNKIDAFSTSIKLLGE
jgi:peptidyl-tRNA hydrolase